MNNKCFSIKFCNKLQSLYVHFQVYVSLISSQNQAGTAAGEGETIDSVEEHKDRKLGKVSN
jgi:hypothetical protein